MKSGQRAAADCDRLLADERTALRRDVARQLGDVETLAHDLDLPRFDLGEIQDLIDERQEVLGVPPHRLERVDVLSLAVCCMLRNKSCVKNTPTGRDAYAREPIVDRGAPDASDRAER